MKNTAVVVLGLSPTGLYVVREAATTGWPVYGFSDFRECASSSRRLANRGKQAVAGMDELGGRLRELASGFDRLAVIPTTDRHVEFLCTAAAGFPLNVHLAESYRDGTARQCLDKAETMRIARSAGLSVPWSVDLAVGWPDEAALSFPLIAKPKAIHRQRGWLKGRKLLLCRDRDALNRVRDLPEFEPEDWTLQELIDGPESNIRVSACYRSRAGETPVTFCGRKLRQYPRDFGSASLMVSGGDTEVRRASHRLLEALGFHGIAGIEFKRSTRSGELKLVEINPRPGLWFGAVAARGHQLVLAQLNEWLGSNFQTMDPAAPAHVVWRYALKDAWAGLSRSASPGGCALPPPEIALPAGAKTVWAVFDRRDPVPALAEIGTYLGKAFSRASR